MNIYIGAKLPLTPHILIDGRFLGRKQKTVTGTVVYINRKHRYFTAEFAFPGGKYRESFKFREKEKKHDRHGNGSSYRKRTDSHS